MWGQERRLDRGKKMEGEVGKAARARAQRALQTVAGAGLYP